MAQKESSSEPIVKEDKASWELSTLNCEDCKFDDCKSLEKIIQILSQYEQWLYNEANKDINCISNVLNKSFASYAKRNLIHHYQHIKDMGYNMSMNNILCTRSLSNCIPFSRHRRDNHDNYEQLYFTKDIKEILIQKMLDQIHLYLYHPLSDRKSDDKQSKDDMNRFGTNKQSTFMDQNEEIKYNDQHQEEQQNNIDIDEEEENKYDNDDEEQEEEEEEKKDEEEEKNESKPYLSVDIVDLEKDAYSFGQQFFYWDYYRDHKWFILPKYDNFKDELINNDICKISQYVWDIEYENALDKKEDDDRVKQLRSNGEFEYKYKIDKDIQITMDHLLSLLFYCNTNDLQKAFSSTYRRLVSVNELDEEFKHRHCNYYWFGRLLRECIEVFGMIMVDDKLALYHGLDHPLYFTEMIAKFYSPTSTSTNRMVAAQFAGFVYVLCFCVFVFVRFIVCFLFVFVIV